MSVRINFPKHIADPYKYEGHISVGLKGSGKSALGEAIAEFHFKHRYIVCDFLDANDFEAAFWGIPGRRGLMYPTLLVHPPWYKISLNNSKYTHIKPICSDVGLKKILRKIQQSPR